METWKCLKEQGTREQIQKCGGNGNVNERACERAGSRSTSLGRYSPVEKHRAVDHGFVRMGLEETFSRHTLCLSDITSSVRASIGAAA